MQFQIKISEFQDLPVPVCLRIGWNVALDPEY